MLIHIITLFPEMFPGSLGFSLAGKAKDKGIWNINVVNLRDFGTGKHKQVDDTSCGGGNGLLIMPEILANALDSIKNIRNLPIFYMSPRGNLFNQEIATSMTKLQELVLICGRFEGIDQRVIEEYNIHEISIGDYILSGGELAALVILDTIIRLLEGTLENFLTVNEESFGSGNYKYLLEYPQYTKPSSWRNKNVPDVLLSGNHEKIRNWRLEEAERITKNRRPDLWDKYKS